MQNPDTLSTEALETGSVLAPRFDKDGLIPAIAQHAETGEVLMLAYMNEEALEKTLQTGQAHYYSRSRKSLWLKGESSGQIQLVQGVFIDCDQDAVLMKVLPQGDGGCCHVGHRLCFYRRIDTDGGESVLTTVAGA